jgi:TonB-dependent starch-binding outer membrane protein SusC
MRLTLTGKRLLSVVAGHVVPFANRRFFTQILRVMRLMVILLFGTCLHVSAVGFSQTVSIKEKNAPLKKVFSRIQQQTGYEIFYGEELLKNSKPVTVDVQNIPVEEAVIIVLKDQHLGYSIVGNNIVIKALTKENSVLNEPHFADAIPPPIDVRGRIVNDKGEPVAGATVMIKGSKRATSTDADGNFMLNRVEEKAQLVITGANIENYEVNVKGQSLLDITVQQKLSPLDQIQIIAYGTTTKRLSTGSISTVKAADIEKQPVTNPLQALQGRVPGLNITQNTGLPGGSFKVEIRGKNTLDGNKQSLPFYVIDGVPYSAQMPGESINSYLGLGSPLNYISPNDIESIDILKDADATSIYGSRAANGAILITTKKAKAGAMKLDINFYTGVTKPRLAIKTLSTQQYLEVRKEAFKNDSFTPGPIDYDINGTWDTTRYTDWVKELMQGPAHFTNGQATLSGGNNNTQYLVSGTFSKQGTGYPAVIKGTGSDQKSSLNFNINSFSLNNKFKLSLSGNYLSDKNTVRPISLYPLIYAPDAPALYNNDGSLNWAPIEPGLPGTWTNPLGYANAQFRGSTANLVSNMVLSYKLFSGLEIKSSFGYTNSRSDENAVTPTTAFDPAFNVASGSAQFQSLNSKSWIIEPQMNYRLQLGKGIFIALLGSTFQENTNAVQKLTASGFPSDALLGNPQSAGSIVVNSSSAQYKYNAVFGRLNYNWQDKYLVNINIRRDGSSRFGPGRQFHSFASIGGAWIFTQERLFQNSPFISFGKIRGSYGTAGSDGIPDYQFLDLYSSTSSPTVNIPYQNGTGLYPANLFNANLAWEETRKLDVGLELHFLKDRLSIEAAYYRNRSGNQLVSTTLPLTTGYGSIQQNLDALVQNAGTEFVLAGTVVQSGNFQWRSSFNISLNKNKLVSFPGLEASPYKNYLIIDKPLGLIKVINYVGVNSTSGLYEFKDSKGNLTSSPDLSTDNFILINMNPKFFGGFQNSLSYKRFNLDFLFQFVDQTGKNYYSDYYTPGLDLNNYPTDVLDRWQKPGDKAAFQKYTSTYGDAYITSYYMSQSNRVYSSASFIRLKNLAFSWQLPVNLIEKAHLKNSAIYIQGQNLMTITSFKGFDPESQGSNVPPVRVWTAGVRISL